MDDDVFAHVHQDLVHNDIPGNPSLYPRMIFGFIPAECVTHDLLAHAYTEYDFGGSPVWEVECSNQTLFKVTVDAPGFHEERAVMLEPGHHYSLADLMGGGQIQLSALQQIYQTYHEAACRSFPKRPYV